MPSEVKAILQDAESTLNQKKINTARLDSELILAHLLGCERFELLQKVDSLSSGVEEQFLKLINRRAEGEPVAYLTGVQAFWNHDFEVNQHTLIPRQDTETLVEVALKLGPQGQANILDLGTGSGCIAISLLDERPEWIGTAVDISSDALNIAAKNAGRIGVEERITFCEGDWFAALEQKTEQFDLIVANPPYIATPDMAALMPDVLHYEPGLALDGGPDGLKFYHSLSETINDFLEKNGLLAVEVGVFQCNDVVDMFIEAGLHDVKIHKDLPGQERVVSARKL